MRFAEFKIFEAPAQPGYYTVGDSHAEGLAAYTGKPWINKAKHTMKSTEPMHMAAIREIPKGSVVVISLGANDATMTNDPPATIASRVASIVDASVANGNKTLFLLFPVGTSTATKPERRKAVRDAIRSSISVPITDLEGKALQSDGVHAQPNVYNSIGKSLARQTPNVSIAPAQTGKPEQGSQPAPTGGFSIDVPQTSLGWKGPGVMDVQKALVALGYDVGPTGIDGIRGKNTVAAIKKYQQDRNLKVDGDPGPETVSALNKDIASAPSKFSSLVKSKPEDVKQSARVGNISAPAPVAYDSVTKGKIGEVLNFVASKESRGYYDMMNGGVRKPEILKMTIRQANQFQRNWRRTTGNSSAMGRYQIMGIEPTNNTFAYAKKAGLDLDKDLFSPENQDKMAIEFLREKGLDSWLAGKMEDEDFLHGLSRVWAAIPDPRKGGRSHYDKVGNNKAGMTTDYALNVLQNIRSA